MKIIFNEEKYKRFISLVLFFNWYKTYLMKKIFITFVIVLISVNLSAQEESIKKHEVKINALYLVLGVPEIGYEYLLNDESSVGIDILFGGRNNDNSLFQFGLTPHYRFYFGEKKCAGFFAEAFGMLNVIESEVYDLNGSGLYEYKNETSFALGFSVGGKFVTPRNGFLIEIFGGIGRNFFNNAANEVVPRFGVTFGKRF